MEIAEGNFVYVVYVADFSKFNERLAECTSNSVFQ